MCAERAPTASVAVELRWKLSYFLFQTLDILVSRSSRHMTERHHAVTCSFFVADQVPLLLSMGEHELGLKKAILSGEDDLVYLVVMHMEKEAGSSDKGRDAFFELMHAHPEALRLLKVPYLAFRPCSPCVFIYQSNFLGLMRVSVALYLASGVGLFLLSVLEPISTRTPVAIYRQSCHVPLFISSSRSLVMVGLRWSINYDSEGLENRAERLNLCRFTLTPMEYDIIKCN